MKPRCYSIDLIRVFAMILVIIVHTKNYFFSPNTTPIIYSILKVIGTVGVPLFVMLTGYLMFNRNYEDPSYLRKFLFKNLIPLLVSFEIWNITWNLLRYTYVFDKPQKWSAIFKAAFFMGDTHSALWYLPMTIALYLGLPLLSTALKKISLSLYKKILLIMLIFSGTVIPSIATITSIISHDTSIHTVLKMNIFGASVWGESVWMIYLLSGFAISKNVFKTIKTPHLIFFGLLCPLIVMCAIELTNKYSVQNYNFILVVILSVMSFELLTRSERFLSIMPRPQIIVLR